MTIQEAIEARHSVRAYKVGTGPCPDFSFFYKHLRLYF